MNEWTTIRRRVLVEKASKRSVYLEFGIGWGTLQKILTYAETAALPASVSEDEAEDRAVRCQR
jgi:hypothetical protein